MKKTFKMLVIVFIAVFMLSIAPNESVSAAKNKTAVTYTLKKGVLTISGKGAMPNNMRFKDNTSIKKVIIKEGITSVSNYAFSGCKKLSAVKLPKTLTKIGWHSFEGTGVKKIKVPKSVKTIGNQAFYNCDELVTIIMPGDFKLKLRSGEDELDVVVSGDKIETVRFNTNFKLDTSMYIEGSYWDVRKNDPLYKDIDGVIYTKDGKEIVRVPSDRKELTIAEGCEVFALQSIRYGYYISDDGVYGRCDELEKITIPASVKRIEDTKYTGKYVGAISEECDEIEFLGTELDAESIITLCKNLKESFYYTDESFAIEVICKAFSERVKKENDCYILDDTILLHYDGVEENVEIPEGIKTIADRAFYPKNVMADEVTKKVILPNSIETIGDYAFASLMSLEEINLPSGLKEIGDCAFYFTKLKKIEIPETVEVYGEYIFEDASLEEAVLPDNMQIIPKGTFSWCTELKEINVPSSLIAIGDEAFDSTSVDVEKFLEVKSLEKIGEKAFNYTDWSSLTIPENIKTIGSMAFVPKFADENVTVTIEGKTDGIENDAFGFEGIGTVNLIFKKSKTGYFTDINDITLTTYLKKKNAVLELYWNKVKGIDGYDIRVYSDKKCTKQIKKVTGKKNQTEAAIKVDKKHKKLYVKIRPYKLVDGKKVYGRWDTETVVQ